MIAVAVPQTRGSVQLAQMPMLEAFARILMSVEFARRVSIGAAQKVMEIVQTKRCLVADLTNKAYTFSLGRMILQNGT